MWKRLSTAIFLLQGISSGTAEEICSGNHCTASAVSVDDGEVTDMATVMLQHRSASNASATEAVATKKRVIKMVSNATSKWDPPLGDWWYNNRYPKCCARCGGQFCSQDSGSCKSDWSKKYYLWCTNVVEVYWRDQYGYVKTCNVDISRNRDWHLWTLRSMLGNQCPEISQCLITSADFRLEPVDRGGRTPSRSDEWAEFYHGQAYSLQDNGRCR